MIMQIEEGGYKGEGLLFRKISLRSLRSFKVDGEGKIKEIGDSSKEMYIRSIADIPELGGIECLLN